jgi:hypothetical protein
MATYKEVLITIDNFPNPVNNCWCGDKLTTAILSNGRT